MHVNVMYKGTTIMLINKLQVYMVVCVYLYMVVEIRYNAVEFEYIAYKDHINVRRLLDSAYGSPGPPKMKRNHTLDISSKSRYQIYFFTCILIFSQCVPYIYGYVPSNLVVYTIYVLVI